MRKLMKLMPLLLMGMLATALSGCEESNKPDLKSNFDRKMTAVTQEVKTTKSTDKALLLVSFGSTWDAPQQSFKELVKSFKAKFPDRDVYFSFTSEICMTRCAQKGWNYYAPQFYMEALGNAGYKDIAVQSLHVIPGEEYLRVQNCLKDFHNHSVEGGKTPFADVTVYLAGPLLYEGVDCDKVAAELRKVFGEKVNDPCFFLLSINECKQNYNCWHHCPLRPRASNGHGLWGSTKVNKKLSSILISVKKNVRRKNMMVS